EENVPRPTARELGITVGFYEPGLNNSITDVKNVKVGHITRIKRGVEIPGMPGKSEVRTGVTAILPGGGDVFNRHIVSSGFVLNGIGELSGLTQAIEWGWIETPILLTNTASVGTIQHGVVDYMLAKHPELQETPRVIIPVVGETDDSFLNDVRIPTLVSKDATRAIELAKSGPVEQGSVGAGTGMTTFDFAGGIGTSSRVLPEAEGGYTIGVLVLSNFGKMRNITIDGTTVGRSLDKIFPMETRRGACYGSVVTIVATDAPLLPNQLHRISKRAALGLGRAGSHARSTSGEIILSFSIANRVSREEKESRRPLTKFVGDHRINPIYEAVIEAVEEAVLNAMFCSTGMDGYNGHFCPGIPQDKVLELINLKHKQA
ncbi:P1 family peptidase, partial [Chloroflexota bacterium]